MEDQNMQSSDAGGQQVRENEPQAEYEQMTLQGLDTQPAPQPPTQQAQPAVEQTTEKLPRQEQLQQALGQNAPQRPQPAATPMIKNPLPLPTPHTDRKELDYDYEVPEDQMHYDIEKPSRNFYDLQ